MSLFHIKYGPLAVLIGVFAQLSMWADDPLPPKIIDFAITNAQKRIRFTPYPAAQDFKVWRADQPGLPFTEDTSGILSGYNWAAPFTGPRGFYRVQVNPISDSALLVGTVLNRLAYGPTPDEIERVTAIGPQAYIAEQLAPESVQESLAIDSIRATTSPTWQYFTASGTGSTASSSLFIYLNAAGEGYFDDVMLVAGSVAGTGANLLRNGDFESPLSTNDWTISQTHAGSGITAQAKHSGNGSLYLVANSPGSAAEAFSITQVIKPSLTNRTYTLSYWYLPGTNKVTSPTVRLASGISSAPLPLSPLEKLSGSAASITDLQSWDVLHAVQSKRQLLEVMTQFVDNHFTTLYTKSRDYLDGRVTNQFTPGFIATDFEFRELKKWREVLMNPNGTFYDLLKISAESPAMVIYLDTVTSAKGAANENYARELMELFTMGVDNGYDQRDIEEMSRSWTGWQVDKLPLGQEANPAATPVSNKDNTPGYWTLRFNSATHDTGAKTNFPGKKIEARFGSPYAGKSYELKFPARTGTAGLNDGYEVLIHLADLPYTQEYISVKLCRLLIHEKFVHGVYDYTDPNLSPEARLIRDCMTAWETPAGDRRKGNLRNVLGVIVNSSLFRQHAASRQKVKTPFEFTVSAVRSIRAAKPTGGFTAESIGTDLLDDMERIGMKLFHREEPDGWSEFGRDWINTSTLVDRMRYIQNFLRAGARTTDPVSDPVALLKLKLPSTKWRDASAVADYFLDLLFLSEGKANLDLDRTAAIAFLNTNDGGTAASLFSSLDPNATNATPYDTRVRGMVALLMGLPRFQEQ